MDLAEFRRDIPATDDAAYLNTGASSPGHTAVVDAMCEFLAYHGYEAPVGEGMYPPVFDAFDDTRAAVASFLNVDSDEIALTQSTGDGISRVVSAIPWESGDTIVRTDLEHPAGVVPWENLEHFVDVDVSVLETDQGHLDLDAVTEAVRGADLVCLSSIAWNYGTSLPIERVSEIAHDAGAEVLVDAVQSVGQTPVDLREWGADYVAAASHKWLVGPWGAGFLYVSEEALEGLHPRHMSYRSVDLEAEAFELHPNAHRLEMGTTSAAPYVGLQRALEIISSIGVGRIEDRIRELTSLLEEELPSDALLSPVPFESGLVTIDDDSPEETVERLADRGVRIRSIPAPEALRVSVHAFNTEADVRAFLDAYDAVRN